MVLMVEWILWHFQIEYLAANLLWRRVAGSESLIELAFVSVTC